MFLLSTFNAEKREGEFIFQMKEHMFNFHLTKNAHSAIIKKRTNVLSGR